MFRKQWVLRGALVLVLCVIVFMYGLLHVAAGSIQFDLRLIGESVYEAHRKNGRWPACVEDLDGTAYVGLPNRRTMLDEEAYVVVWNHDLAPNPQANRDRVLAYDNSSLLSRFGRVWVCRGDLRLEYIEAGELQRLLNVQ